VRYHKIGDQVDQQATATLSWSATGADTVSIDPLGSVPTSGERAVQAAPTKTAPGPVDETVTYTLRASNACGGSETRTASLHIVGSIESGVSASALESKFNFDSIYFPYDMPRKAHPEGGLLTGEQKRMEDLPAFFKQYLEFEPQARLILEGHADHRGSIKYNRALSQRRAERVKSYLVSKCAPAASIETNGYGKERNLTTAEVKQLNEQNPNLTPQEPKRIARRMRTYRMANNRRVDIRLSPANKESHRYFPYGGEDDRGLLSERHHHGKRSDNHSDNHSNHRSTHRARAKK